MIDIIGQYLGPIYVIGFIVVTTGMLVKGKMRNPNFFTEPRSARRSAGYQPFGGADRWNPGDMYIAGALWPFVLFFGGIIITVKLFHGAISCGVDRIKMYKRDDIL